jgi:hypothetical protein
LKRVGGQMAGEEFLCAPHGPGDPLIARERQVGSADAQERTQFQDAPCPAFRSERYRDLRRAAMPHRQPIVIAVCLPDTEERIFSHISTFRDAETGVNRSLQPENGSLLAKAILLTMFYRTR